MLTIRTYEKKDWDAIARIHDDARKIELDLAGLQDAFLPLAVAAEREDLFGYPGLFVAESDGVVVGFAACTGEELAWLYVDPGQRRRGIGRSLIKHAFHTFPGLHSIEVLKGNTPAVSLYESMGFAVIGTETGSMPGNEDFTVEVCCMERRLNL